MDHPSLETLAARLWEPLRRVQADLNRTVVERVSRGQPLAKAERAAVPHLSLMMIQSTLRSWESMHLKRFPQMGKRGLFL
jgi:hypothetical protein